MPRLSASYRRVRPLFSPFVLFTKIDKEDPIFGGREMTRCDQPATKATTPKRERCKKHQAQVSHSVQKWNSGTAAEIFDELKNNIPDQGQIDQWKESSYDSQVCRSYQVEGTGRQIHQRRFFLKGAFRGNPPVISAESLTEFFQFVSCKCSKMYTRSTSVRCRREFIGLKTAKASSLASRLPLRYKLWPSMIRFRQRESPAYSAASNSSST